MIPADLRITFLLHAYIATFRVRSGLVIVYLLCTASSPAYCWLSCVAEISSIWTSGKFQAGEFRWADSTPVSAGFTRWSKTGPMFQPQPDNAEGFEDCLTVHNDLYSDGVAWHDEQCSYRKHFVCEV